MMVLRFRFSQRRRRATRSRPAIPVQNMSGTPCSMGERRRFLRQAIGGRRRRRNDRFYIGTELWRDRRAAISHVGRRGLRGPVERTVGCGGAGFHGRSMRRCRAAGLGMRQISLGFTQPKPQPYTVSPPPKRFFFESPNAVWAGQRLKRTGPIRGEPKQGRRPWWFGPACVRGTTSSMTPRP